MQWPLPFFVPKLIVASVGDFNRTDYLMM